MNEIISQDFERLSHQALRRLEKTSGKLRVLVEDYLCGFNCGFFSFFNVLILKFAECLSLEGCSRLARSSYRFIMGHKLREGIQNDEVDFSIFQADIILSKWRGCSSDTSETSIFNNTHNTVLLPGRHKFLLQIAIDIETRSLFCQNSALFGRE